MNSNAIKTSANGANTAKHLCFCIILAAQPTVGNGLPKNSPASFDAWRSTFPVLAVRSPSIAP